MAGGGYQLMLNGPPADQDLYTAITSLEVEESMDMPGAGQLSIPITRADDGDLNYVSDGPFGRLASLAVVTTATGGSGGAAPAAASAALGGGNAPAQCIFDGYVLSHRIHLETGATKSTLAVWGQDASWL